MRTLRKLLIALFVIVALSATLFAGSGIAQDATPVDGTADFRAPPFIGNGTFTDTIVAGEAVWYAVIYTNDNPYRIEVSVPSADLDNNPDLELETQFISPTLGAVQTGSDVLAGRGSITGGGPDTNAWFIQIALNTTGRLGVEHEVIFEVEGVEESGIEDCAAAADCTLDDDLASLDEELEDIQESLIAIENAGDDESAIVAETARLEAEVAAGEAAIANADARTEVASDQIDDALEDIAAVCAPERDCDEAPDPGSSTPLVGLIVGGVILVGGLTLLGIRFVL